MNIYAANLPVVHLKPGELVITKKPTLAVTVLGSCVSAIMYCARVQIGAMCHGVLPEDNGRSPEDEYFRYVDNSLHYMIEALTKMGISITEIDVKLFGGANRLLPDSDRVQAINVGRRNAEIALDIVRNRGMNLSAYDLGGNQGRKVIFYTHTGKVLMKKIN
ncbi:MAG: chemotaxis protein CheD [Firmicutes bacterium]|nr:chemotaxis protein CheD [Bacillota bacterium]